MSLEIASYVAFSILEFYYSYKWLDIFTLVYFLGRVPLESMLKYWVGKAWNPHGICYYCVKHHQMVFYLSFAKVNYVLVILN